MSYSIAKEKKWSKNGWEKVPSEGGRGGDSQGNQDNQVRLAHL